MGKQSNLTCWKHSGFVMVNVLSLNVLSISESPTIVHPPLQLHRNLPHPMWIMNLKILNVPCHFTIILCLFTISISKTRQLTPENRVKLPQINRKNSTFPTTPRSQYSSLNQNYITTKMRSHMT